MNQITIDEEKSIHGSTKEILSLMVLVILDNKRTKNNIQILKNE